MSDHNKAVQVYFRLILVLIVIGTSNAVDAQHNPERISVPISEKISSAQIAADYEILRSALLETYGGIYRLADSATVERRFALYRKKLAAVHDQLGFISLVNKLIASFREGHMEAEYDEGTNHLLNSSKLFPFTVVVENEKLVVLCNETGYDQTVLPGMEILSINEVKAKQLIKVMMPHISADGYGYAHRHKRLADNFPENLWLYFGQQDGFIVTAKDSTGKEVITKVGGVNEKQREANRLLPINFHVRQGARKLERRGPNILLSFINEGKTGNLRIQGFKGKDFLRELDSVFKLLNQRNARTLILDLRGNGGGEDMYGAALVSHLTSAPFRYFNKIQMRTIKPSFGGWSESLIDALRKGTIADPMDRHIVTAAMHAGVATQQPSAITFDGGLFVLTDGYTFSTAADAAAVIRQNTSAVFIGEETGGGAEGNTSGIFARVNLSNSGLSVNIPAWCYWNDVTVRKKHRGVLPDHPLINTVNDIINSNDRQWNHAVALAQKSTN